MTSLASLGASASGLDGDILSFQSGVYVTPNPTTSAPPEATPTGDESWWEWLTHKAEGVEDWVDDFLHKHVPGKSGNDAPA
jgi:hypothetical protein